MSQYLRVLTVIIIVAFVSLLAVMYVKGGMYMSSKGSGCFHETGSGALSRPFCNIRVIRIDLPREFRIQLHDICSNPLNGKRVKIPFWKAGRTISTRALFALLPHAKQYYHHMVNNVTRVVGEAVFPTGDDYPTSCCVLIYEKVGDWINWHYDVNHYVGRFFTLLIPITIDDTCTMYKYRSDMKSTKNVRLRLGTALLFEGEHVFHMASKICSGQVRYVLSMQFVTEDRLKRGNKFMLRLKDSAYVGLKV